MERSVKYEIPESKPSLVSICINLVRVFDLVRDDLMELTTFELHLFLVELVLNNVVGALLAGTVLAVSLLLVIDLAHGDGDALAIITCTVIILIIKHLDGVRLLQVFEARLLIRVVLLCIVQETFVRQICSLAFNGANLYLILSFKRIVGTQFILAFVNVLHFHPKINDI